MYCLFKIKEFFWKFKIYLIHLIIATGLVVILSICFSNKVYATTTPVTDSLKAIGVVVEDFKQANQYTWTQISDFIDTMSRVVGMPKKPHSSGGHAFDPSIVKQIDPNVDDTDPNSIGTWISNQISIQDNDDITVTNNFREMFNDINDTQKRSYCYSFSVRDIAKFFPTTTPYDALLSELDPYKDRNGIWMYQYVNSTHFVYYLDLSHDPNLVWKAQGTVYPTGDLVSAKPYGSSGLLTQVDFIIKWDKTNEEWVTHTNSNLSSSVNNYMSWSPHGTTVQSQTCYWFNINPKQYRWFDKTDTINAETIKYQDYYYNEEVWNDFSTSSGDYTFDADNINTVTYGDITTYIDSFNNENGYPPTVSDINVYIEDKNDDDDGGGGSGSGDDDSGGGGSGIGDIGDIFGWLKQLGSVIASLIKGVGEFVTEIMGGIVEAINTLLDGLSDIITTVTEAIPSVFMQFIQACFDWMPDEWIALLTASLLLMILWGIIKLIRGS